MPENRRNELVAWGQKSGVTFSDADLERIETLAGMYLERVNALRGLDLEREPSVSADVWERQQAG